MIEGLKVVTSQEMARIEKGMERGEQFMKEAGRQVALAVIQFAKEESLEKRATLLVGRGNNGGDAYAAGLYLLDAGFHVEAIAVEGKRSFLNETFRKRFQKKGGPPTSRMRGIIVDGLLGTGFKGAVDEKMARVIEEANRSGLPIVAIDIPSGLNGNNGEVEGVAIQAAMTIALGLPKIGCFLRDGWNYVGRLKVVDFGLPKEAVAQAEAVAYLPKHLALPKIVRNRHKYEAGYVVGYGGSKRYPGAVQLSGLAALKGGAGIVKIFSVDEIRNVPLELIVSIWNRVEWNEALGKAKAVFVGPGLGKGAQKWLKAHLKEIQLPCVIDADALLPGLSYPKMAVLTPHRGEALRLLGLKTEPREEEFFAKIIRYCNAKRVVLLLKGAPTFVFAPKTKPVIVTRGDPGMATAGSGDVLTGLIAGLLAQGATPREGAILGAVLHGIAGEEGAKKRTSYCLTARDLIKFFPAAFGAAMQGDIL